MKARFISFLLIGTISIIGLGADVSSSQASTTNPYGGTAIKPPAPTETILTVTNGTGVKKYSMNVLTKMKLSEIKIFEPFVKVNQTFTAIPLSALFAASGIVGKASVKTIALNDYIYTNTAKSFIAANGYLAIARTGKPIPYDQGGPIRIIFPNSSIWAKNLDPWNWSLKAISVK